MTAKVRACDLNGGPQKFLTFTEWLSVSSQYPLPPQRLNIYSAVLIEQARGSAAGPKAVSWNRH